MSQSPESDNLDLEKEFIKMNQTLAIDIVKYTTFGFFSLMVYSTLVATYTGGPLWVLLHIAITTSVAVSLRAIWSARKIYEKGITAFCILFYLSGIAMEYKNQTYFQDPYEAFFFSCNYAVFERILGEGISNLRYRMIFSGVIIVMRSIILPRIHVSGYIIQFLLILMSTLVDLMSENRNKHFFYSYINAREQLSKFKDLVVNHIPEAMIIVSQDLTSNLFMNKSFSKLIGSVDLNVKSQLDQFVLKQELNTLSSINSLENTSSSLPKKTLFDFLKVIDHRFIQRQSCIVTCKAEDNELIDLDKETHFLFEVKLFSMVWDNKPSIAVILHDITEHHTILSLRIADTQKDKVLATVSHELKTPLNGILGMIQIMEKKIKESELLKFLTICKNSTNLLLSLVNSILDLNQIKAKKIRLNIERVDVQEVLERIVNLFDYQCCQKGIYLNTNIAQGTPRFVMTDKDRLIQVLINLVGNAHKFTSKGGIVINVSRESENSVRFSVEDTGIGILEEDKSKLFQIFGRVSHNSEKLNRQGVGLGLTIAKNLVHVLNDSNEDVQEINIDSEYGQGSRFSLVIVNRRNIRGHEEQKFEEEENLVTWSDNYPGSGDLTDKLGQYVMQTRINNQSITHSSSNYSQNLKYQSLSYSTIASNSISNRASNAGPNQVKTRSATCILLVDDNLFNIAVAEHLILSHGYKVKTALSGQNAIDLVTRNDQESEKISLIFMDCQMPVMDGYETTRILKRMMVTKEIPTVPIVALTANDSEGDKETCRKVGMVDHLSKPLNDAELGRILKKYL